MSEAATGERRSRRGPRTPKPEPPPTCPDCGGILETDPTEAGTLIGVCANPACAAWTLYRRAESGTWTVVERISRDRRTDPRAGRSEAIRPAAG